MKFLCSPACAARMGIRLTERWMSKLVPWYSLDSFKREFKLYLPFWFLYLEAFGLLHLGLANFPDSEFEALGIPRYQFALTVFFPLAWMALFLWLRWRQSTRLPRDVRGLSVYTVLLLALPVLIALFHRPHALDHDQLTALFEFSQFIWVGLFVVQIAWTRGFHGLVLFFGVTFVYGMVLENTGIIMHFFFEPSFRYYLPPFPAPLCTMLGWCVVFYVTVAIVEQLAQWFPWLKKGAGRRACVATLLALSMDAQLDPLASMSGVFWRWNDLLPPAFLGVPFINFAAWLGAFLPYTWIMFRVMDRKEWSPREKNWELFLRIALACVLGGVLCFGVMAIWERGFDGPTFQILSDFTRRLTPY